MSKLENIWDTIVADGKKNKRMFNESDFTPYFCNIFDYFEVVKVNLNRESSYRLERRKIL